MVNIARHALEYIAFALFHCSCSAECTGDKLHFFPKFVARNWGCGFSVGTFKKGSSSV